MKCSLFISVGNANKVGLAKRAAQNLKACGERTEGESHRYVERRESGGRGESAAICSVNGIEITS